MGHNTASALQKETGKTSILKTAFEFLYLDGGNLNKIKLAETQCKSCGAKVTNVTCFVHLLHRKWSQGNWLLTSFFFQQQFWVSLIPAFVLYSVEILPRWNGSDFSIGLAFASETTAVQKWMHLVIFITAVFNLNSKLTALKCVIPLQTWRVFLKLWISENGRKWRVGLCLEITALFFWHSQVLGPCS